MSDFKTARVMYILNQAFAQLLILLLYMKEESHSMILRIVDRWNDGDMKERLKRSLVKNCR